MAARAVVKTGWVVVGWIGLVVAAAVAVLIILLQRDPPSVVFKPFKLDEFTASLVPILVIALLVERAIEVFFGIVREPEESKIRAALGRAREGFIQAGRGRLYRGYTLLLHRLPRGGRAQLLARSSADRHQYRQYLLEEAETQILAEQQRLDGRKADNTRLASILGGALGILVALAGVRTLDLLLDGTTPWLVPGVDGTVAGRPGWWVALDVFLTAGLIGGGAEGFHRITSVLGTYMTRLSETNKFNTPQRA
ncbi:MAG: hypothetical protein ACREOC_07385 [Gemmatimonadales bacterium]